MYVLASKFKDKDFFMTIESVYNGSSGLLRVVQDQIWVLL